MDLMKTQNFVAKDILKENTLNIKKNVKNTFNVKLQANLFQKDNFVITFKTVKMHQMKKWVLVVLENILLMKKIAINASQVNISKLISIVMEVKVI